MARFAVHVAFTSIAWGAISFGAVYPWGYWPLALVCQLCGLTGLLVRRRPGLASVTRGLAVSLTAFAAATTLQLVPVPVSWIGAASPRTVDALRSLDPAFAAGLAPLHPISIAPHDTLVALLLFGAFAIFLLGLTRLLATTGARRFAEMLTGFGCLLAVAGIIQKPLYAGRIFGFWTPVGKGDPFGPFVNRNHFAGWMLLALPVTLGLLCAGLERASRDVKQDWRSRLLWLSSPDASRLVLIAAAAIVMALSLVLTMSRSGIAALALSVAVAAGVVLRADGAGSRKLAGAAYLLVLAVTVTGWVGIDTIESRFSKTNWTEFNNRKGAWADALDVARQFPAAGTGLNTYGTATLIYQRHDLGSHYAQSHNDYLQVAAEGGALLVLPACFCVFFLMKGLRRRLREARGSTSWWLRAGAATSLVAIALQESVEFSLQMPGNAALFAAVCAIALHEARPGAPSPASAPPLPQGRPVLRHSRALQA